MPVNLKQLNCPNCGAPLNRDGKYDKPIVCPYCGSQFMPGPTEVDDVWLMTDPVARARFEFNGTLDKFEHDICYEVLRGGPWQPEDLEYKSEISRLLREGLIADKGAFWFRSPHPTVYRARRDGLLTIAGRVYRFRAGDDLVFQCRMERDDAEEDPGPVLIARLQSTEKAVLCGEMSASMKGTGRQVSGMDLVGITEGLTSVQYPEIHFEWETKRLSI